MKRISIVLLVILSVSLIVAAFSCTKSSGGSGSSGYVCTCTVGSGGGVSGNPYTTSTLQFQGLSATDCTAKQTSLQHTYGVATAANGYNGVWCNMK